MEKVRYELDPHNRLVLKSGRKGGFTGFRKVLDGRFKTDENNELSYHAKSPYHSSLCSSDTGHAPVQKDKEVPNQLKLRGRWSLTGNHNLRLTMDKQARETFGDKITLQGEVLDVNANSLLFAVTTKTKKNTQSTYVLDLKGKWKADKNNRLSFHVKKEKDNRDILTFRGAWEINKNHEIIYDYEKADLIRKKGKTHALTFKGYWDIKEKFRISYILSKNTNSAFNFITSAGIFKGKYIKYEVGIGLSGKAKQTVTLLGKWKMKKNAELIFEVEYGNKKIHGIVFGAEAKLTSKDAITFKLKNDIENRDMGISVKLSHKILKGAGVAFIRALRSNRESAIYAQAVRRW